MKLELGFWLCGEIGSARLARDLAWQNLECLSRLQVLNQDVVVDVKSNDEDRYLVILKYQN